MRYHLVTGLIGAIAFAGLLLVPQPEPVPTQVCVEDMACWDCETMGNKICGKDDGE